MFLKVAIFTLALLHSLPAAADKLELPRGNPILVVSGLINSMNVADTASFDREMLEALGSQTITTKTPWFDGEATFSGIGLDKLMTLVGASGKSVTAVALNNYVTTIPIEDFSKYKVILALKRDGQYMSVRDKGPLFIMYPFDSDPKLQTQEYFGRAAWQVARLIVE